MIIITIKPVVFVSIPIILYGLMNWNFDHKNPKTLQKGDMILLVSCDKLKTEIPLDNYIMITLLLFFSNRKWHFLPCLLVFLVYFFANCLYLLLRFTFLCIRHLNLSFPSLRLMFVALLFMNWSGIALRFKRFLRGVFTGVTVTSLFVLA